MAAANLNYRFIRDRANVNLNVSYTGDQLDDDFGTFPATRVALDGYTLVNLAAEFAVTARVAIYGRVENLFDEDYENVFGFAPSGIGGFVGARIKFSN
jgi:vitamin B12 transporter